MDTQRALEQLRGRLETSFGKALAMLILASACNDADVSMVGLTPDQYGRLVEAVSRDQRVVDMWGTAGAADVAAQWRELVA